MARDLPYFKFIVSEWNDGDIRLCSFEAQGLFINLCALYWSSGGNLSLAKSMRRYSACNAVAFEELQQEGIIKVDGDNISISFLDEQFEERSQLSRKNAENAANGWGKRKKDATALPNNATVLPKESDPIDLACNIEKRREEEKRKEEKRGDENAPMSKENLDKLFFDPDSGGNQNQILTQMQKTYGGRTVSEIREAWEKCYTHHSLRPSPPQMFWEWRQKLNTWLDINSQRNATRTGSEKTIRGADTSRAPEEFSNGGGILGRSII